MISQEITNIILNIIFIASFIAIFFFSYGTRVEREVIKSQVNYALIDLLGDIRLVANQEELSTLKQYVATLQPPNLSKEDKLAAKHNKELLTTAIIIFSILFIIGIIISIILSKIYKFSLLKLLFLNFIILIFIAFTEFSFLTFIGKRYKSLDPNYVIVSILKTLQKFSKD